MDIIDAALSTDNSIVRTFILDFCNTKNEADYIITQATDTDTESSLRDLLNSYRLRDEFNMNPYITADKPVIYIYNANEQERLEKE